MVWMRGSFNQWRFLWPWTLIRIISGITVKHSWPLAALLWNIQFSSAVSMHYSISLHFSKTNLIIGIRICSCFFLISHTEFQFQWWNVESIKFFFNQLYTKITFQILEIVYTFLLDYYNYWLAEKMRKKIIHLYADLRTDILSRLMINDNFTGSDVEGWYGYSFS